MSIKVAITFIGLFITFLIVRVAENLPNIYMIFKIIIKGLNIGLSIIFMLFGNVTREIILFYNTKNMYQTIYPINFQYFKPGVSLLLFNVFLSKYLII
jgi:hypothetical protein